MEYPQRIEYLRGEHTHDEWYGSIARAAGISYDDAEIMPRVRAALAEGDEHLNSIPLREWDIRAAGVQHVITPAAKLHGDFWSLSVGVSTLKAAARIAAAKSSASERNGDG